MNSYLYYLGKVSKALFLLDKREAWRSLHLMRIISALTTRLQLKLGYLGLSLLTVAMVSSCAVSPGSKSGNSSSSPVVLDNNNAANTLVSLPDLKMKNAPDSLSANSDMKMKSMLRVPLNWALRNNDSVRVIPHWRNEGDVTGFDLSSLQDVKSQGWINMRSQLKETTVVLFLDILKSFASNQIQAGTPIPTNTVVPIGSHFVSFANQSLDLGYIRCIMPATNEFDVFWSFKLDMSSVNGSSTKGSGPMIELINLYIHIIKDINGKSKVDFLAKVYLNGVDSGQVVYSRYDEAAGRTDNFNLNGPGNFQLSSIFPDNNVTGALTIMGFGGNSYSYTNSNYTVYYYDPISQNYTNSNAVDIYASTYTNLSIGWGDDLKGGVISLYISKNNDSISGNSSNATINTEFYNGNGGLVFKSYGTAAAPDTSYLSSYIGEGSFNLANLGNGTAPDSVTITSLYTNYYYTYSDPVAHTNAYINYYTNYTKIDDGTHSSNLSGYIGSIYWKANPNSSTWLPGDSVYWYNSGSYSYINTNNYDAYVASGYTSPYYYVYGSQNINTYNIGYTVPTATVYLYKRYYMQNSWPLKYLTLNSPYNSGYELTRQEGEHQDYSYTYYDQNFNAVTYNYSYTNYFWWLKNAGQTARVSNVVTNVQWDNITSAYDITNIYTNFLSAANGDISIQNVNIEDVYVWDPNSTNMYQQKGLFVYGSGQDPALDDPKYFAFNQKGLIQSVEANIVSIYENNVNNFDLNSYQSNIPAMPDTNAFPPVP